MISDIKAVNYRIRTFRGAWWFRIFYHNLKGGFFINESEAKSSNSQYKFSILGDINDHPDEWKINDIFEFLLIYPGKTGFNRWKQTIFPLSEDSSLLSDKVTGFEDVSCSWITNKWGGLAKITTPIWDDESSQIIPSLLKGTIGSINWFYSIGYYGKHANFKNSMPSNDGETTEVELWIRIKRNFFCTKCLKNKRTSALTYAFMTIMQCA